MKDTVGLKDHTPDQLAQGDNPYARRHGSIQIHQDKPWSVHYQSGDMWRSIRGAVVAGPKYSIKFDDTKAPHAKYVLEGTKNMLPRNVLGFLMDDKILRNKMMKEAIIVLGKELRTKSTVRFG